MYAIAIVRYRRPLEEVLTVVDEHRAYLRDLHDKGLLLATGPFNPRSGGAMILRVGDAGANEALDAIRDGDPYVIRGIAQYEMWPWEPVIGKEALDRITCSA